MLYLGLNTRYIQGPNRGLKKLKASEIHQVTEVNASKIHALDSNVLHPEQKQDITCKQLSSQSYCSNKNSCNPVVLSASGILQKQQ